jgi:hypothetical protein
MEALPVLQLGVVIIHISWPWPNSRSNPITRCIESGFSTLSDHGKRPDNISSIKIKGASDTKCASSKPCMYCNDTLHSLDSCKQLSTLFLRDRIAYLRCQGLCFGCLKLGHSRDRCRCKAICQICQYHHPKVLVCLHKITIHKEDSRLRWCLW